MGSPGRARAGAALPRGGGLPILRAMESVSTTAVLSQPALEAWAAEVGEAVVSRRARGARVLPVVLALRGPLGAGKSVLARALARGAGVTSPMPSPTYNLLFTYAARGDVMVHHLDLYRLDDPEDVWELGWEELGVGEQVVLIEWPERAEALLPADRWEVTLDFVDAETRRIRLARVGSAPELPPLPEVGL
jgi:tRNA threonylcarbamoyladenosine biosynthesis protein TsaE